MSYSRRGILVQLCLLALLATIATAKPALFESSDPKEIILTLKRLRSPEFSAAVPAILPLLHHKSANVVRDACRTLAVIADKDVIPAIEPLLNDKRDNVRKDAQDAIYLLRLEHPARSADAAGKISPAFSSSDPGEVTRMLKLVRSPEFASLTPSILPLLHHDNSHLVRDACRTLAVIANKDAIPAIEPLLNDKRADVRKDARDAIDKLKLKS